MTGRDPLRASLEATFAAQVEAHRGHALRLATRMLGDRAAAEDVVAEAMVRAWRAWPRYRPVRATPKAWLLRIVWNTAVAESKLRARHGVVSGLTETLAEVLADPAPTAEERRVAATLADERLQAAVAAVPECHRAALLLLAEGLEYAEVARRLGVPVGTVRSRIARARRAAVRELEGANAD